MTEQEQTHNSQFVAISGIHQPQMRIDKRYEHLNWEDEDQWMLHNITSQGVPRYTLTEEQECKHLGWDYEETKKEREARWTKEAEEARRIKQLEKNSAWVTVSSEIFSQVLMIELAGDYSKERNWEDQAEWDLYRTDYGIKRYRLSADQARKWLG